MQIEIETKSELLAAFDFPNVRNAFHISAARYRGLAKFDFSIRSFFQLLIRRSIYLRKLCKFNFSIRCGQRKRME